MERLPKVNIIDKKNTWKDNNISSFKYIYFIWILAKCYIRPWV